jgi:hypothetical protein
VFPAEPELHIALELQILDFRLQIERQNAPAADLKSAI